jgi:hypothetical protein
MKIVVHTEYSFGDIVSTKLNPECAGIVSSYYLTPGNSIQYEIRWCDEKSTPVSTHYGMEIQPYIKIK